MKKLIAFFLLLLGISYLLVNLGLADEELLRLFTTYWPLLIVLFGLKLFVEGIGYFLSSLRRDRKHIGKIVWAAIVTGAGLVLFGGTADWFDFTPEQLWNWLWPLILIYLAFKLLIDRNKEEVIELDPETAERHKQGAHPRAPISEYSTAKEPKDTPEFRAKRQHTLFGDLKIGKNAWEPDGMDVHLGVGDANINFSKAQLYKGDNHIKIGAWLGDVKLIVPEDISVKITSKVSLGDIKLFKERHGGMSRTAEYKSQDFDSAERRLIIEAELGIGDIKVVHSK